MPTTPLQFSDLANQINEFMAGQANNQYVNNLPNYANMVGSRTQNIGQQLKGQLPQDVINQIGQQAAERGISGGSPGSPNSNAAYLRALGLNSLQMQQQGNQNLSTAIGDTPVSPLFNPASMIVPNYFGQQELNNARLGLMTGRKSGGVQTPGVSGMPNLGSRAPASNGMFNSPSFTNGMYTGGGSSPSSGSLASNWWNPYGGRDTSLPSNDWGMSWDYDSGSSPTGDQYGGSNANFGQFDEEDNYFSGMPNNYVEPAPANAWGGEDYSDPDFDWFG